MLTKNQIKLINSLSLKKNRQKHQLFVVEGEKLVNEILESDWEIDSIFATDKWLGLKTYSVTENELKKISFLKTPNKVLALVKCKTNNIPIDGDTILALDGVKDPGNLGTIIRLAEWYGIRNILCSEDTVDCLNPKVVQATMGSIFRVNLHYINLVESIQKLDDYGLYISVLNGESIDDIKNNSKKIIVLGGESLGVREDILKLKGQKITIVKSEHSRAESLNVAVASAIILSRFNFFRVVR